MNAHAQEGAGGIRSLVRDMAERGSVMGTWNEQRVQDVFLERRGTVDMPLFDSVSATFAAIRYLDERSRLATSYVLGMTGSLGLTLEELPEAAKIEIKMETLSAANGKELNIQTENMTAEAAIDPMEFVDEDEYAHTHAVQYRINGSGEIIECVRTDEYTHQGEMIMNRHYSEPYRRGKVVVGITEGDFVKKPVSDFDIMSRKELAQALAVDVALLEYAQDLSCDRELLRSSRQQHERRVLAISAFIMMRSDPIESLQIALS